MSTSPATPTPISAIDPIHSLTAAPTSSATATTASTDASSSTQSSSSSPDAGDFQLLIENDKDANALVYKTVDRRSGQVISQFPRDQLLRMSETSSYTAGAVISTTA